METILYTRQKDIDKNKWDTLIADSPVGFIYSRSFFLDAMCNWDALILGDYEFVMPLPYRKKAGFQYLYTPFFTGQLGITGKTIPGSAICNAFLKAIPSSFSLADIQLNEYNTIEPGNPFKITERVNYIIQLDKGYPDIANHFNKDAKKNIRQAEGHGLHTYTGIPVETVCDFYKNAYAHLNRRIKERDYDNFLKVCRHAMENETGFTYAVKNKNNETVAAAFFAIDNKRVYYLMGAPAGEGKRLNATHFLINEVLKKFAGSSLVFDFEGSDIPSVAGFYKKFGPQKKTYPQVIINRLPFWIKWMKKR